MVCPLHCADNNLTITDLVSINFESIRCDKKVASKIPKRDSHETEQWPDQTMTYCGNLPLLLLLLPSCANNSSCKGSPLPVFWWISKVTSRLRLSTLSSSIASFACRFSNRILEANERERTWLAPALPLPLRSTSHHTTSIEEELGWVKRGTEHSREVSWTDEAPASLTCLRSPSAAR